MELLSPFPNRLYLLVQKEKQMKGRQDSQQINELVRSLYFQDRCLENANDLDYMKAYVFSRWFCDDVGKY